jgi:DmsE family decaheme c-type cytochrome
MGEGMSVTCENCHRGWDEHIKNPSGENIETPGEVLLLGQSEICGQCHLTAHQCAMVSTDRHSREDLTCVSCHTIHDNYIKKLVKEDLDNFCLSCHTSIGAEFQRRSSHPLDSNNIRCVDCHNLGSIELNGMNMEFDWVCQGCHEEIAGPYLYEHPAVYDHLVEGGSCTECHEPHGSINDMLLKQTGMTLCNQCHTPPPGHSFNHNGLGAREDCALCHSQVHGSFDSRIFLNPDLGQILYPDCYQSGCHSFGN